MNHTNIKIIDYTDRNCVSTSIECGCIIQAKQRIMKNISRGFTPTENGELKFGCQAGSRIVEVEIDNIIDNNPLQYVKDHIAYIEQDIIKILSQPEYLGEETDFLIFDHKDINNIKYEKEKNTLNIPFARGFRKKIIEKLLSS